MPEQALVVRAHDLRRAHPDFLDRLHAAPGVDDDRERRHEPDQQDRGGVAEVEPEHEQRRIGDAGDRRPDADQRQRVVLDAARAPHENAERDADHCGEREAGGEAPQRLGDVQRQDARHGEPVECGRDRLERRKQLRREYAEMGDDLPQGAEHQEREGVARDRPQRALAPAADLRGASSVSGRADIARSLWPGRAKSRIKPADR